MIGTVQTSVLTDIANAIRQQNGTAGTYRPGDMAAAVRALDGTSAGAPASFPYNDMEEGALSSVVLEDVADAIRSQNGSEEEYLPEELAPAILALTFDVGLKIRALLLDDGTLELNYRSVRSSTSGAGIVSVWEVPETGYSAPYAIPWKARSDEITRISLDDDLMLSGLQKADSFFSSMGSVTEVWNLGALQNVPSMRSLLYNCEALETIWADGYDPIDGQSGSSAVSGCSRLVGGRGGTVSAGDGSELFHFGEAGVLTRPGDDQRQWFRAFLYDDGELVFTASEEPDAGRTLVARDHACANAIMDHIIQWPWKDDLDAVTHATVASDMEAYPVTNTALWFYDCSSLEAVTGLSHLRGTRTASSMFSMCTSLETVDLRGFPFEALEDVSTMFYECASLTTIYADPDWELPPGATGNNVFRECEALVGGNGTAWSVAHTNHEYLRIDGEGEPGYLTASS